MECNAKQVAPVAARIKMLREENIKLREEIYKKSEQLRVERAKLEKLLAKLEMTWLCSTYKVS